jgi:hypothetical protein
MSLQYTKGMFNNYIKAFPQEKNRMFLAMEFIIEQGTGGNLLDQLSKKTFKDTNAEYINRLKKEAVNNEGGLFIVFDALIKWYETWKDSYKKFTATNAHLKYKEQPIHTWLHCLLTGQQNIYMNLIEENYIIIEKSKWEALQNVSVIQRSRPMPVLVKEKEDSLKLERIERLMKLYEKDEEFRVKELLYDKKIAIFLEDSWSKESLDDFKNKFHLKGIKQFSSITPISDTGKFDYYLFLTSQASHSAKYKLESRVGKESTFLISATNQKLVIEEFIKQLKGK